MERSLSWNYFVNVAGTELPITPYSDFEQVAVRANGNNVMESYMLPSFFFFRINRYFQLQRFENYHLIKLPTFSEQ